MSFSNLLDLLVTLLPIVAIAVFFFFYYNSPKVQAITKKVLKFAPFLISILASKVPDKKGVFDKHDLAVLTGRLLQHVDETVSDPTNTSFEDVQDDLFEFVRTELDRYRNAGVKNVPDLNDEVIRVQVQVVFQSIQRALSEDSAGDASTN